MPDKNTLTQEVYNYYSSTRPGKVASFDGFQRGMNEDEGKRRAVYDILRREGALDDTWNYEDFTSSLSEEYAPQRRDQKNKAVIEQNAQTNIQNWQANQQAFPTQPKAAPSTAPAPLDPAKQPVPVEQGGLTEEQKKYYSAQADSLMVSNDSAMADFNAFADVAKTPDLSPLKFQPKTNEQIKEEAYMGAWMDSENARKAEAALNAHYQELGMPTKGNTSEIDWDKLTSEASKEKEDYLKTLKKYEFPKTPGEFVDYYLPTYASPTGKGKTEFEEAKRGIEAAQAVEDLAILNSNLAKGVSGDRRKLYAGWLDEKWEDIATLGITGMNRNMVLYDIAKRASKGEKLLPVEERALNAMVSNQELASQLYDSWLASFGAGARGIAEFVAEMRLTGGVGKAIKGSSTIVSKGARKILEGGIRTLTAAGAQAVVMPSTYEHMSQNLLGLYDVGISYGPDGKYNTIVERNDKSAGYAAYKAWASQTGMLFGFDAMGQVAKVAPAWIDKLAKTKGWAKPINNVLKWEERMQKSGKWNDRLTSFITKNTGSSAQMSVSMRVANVTSALATGDWEEVKGMLDPKQLSVDLAVGFVFGGLGDVARLGNRLVQKWQIHDYNKKQHKAYRNGLEAWEGERYETKEAELLRKEFLGVLVKDLDGTQDISKMVERMRQVGGKLETAIKYRKWEYDKLDDELEKGAPTEARRAEIEGRMGELRTELDEYTEVAETASALEQRALYLKGVVEGTALTLEDQIGEFRSRTSPWPAVTVIRDRDTGKDYFLLDDKGEVSVVRGMTRDAQPFDMKNTSYDIVFKVPLEEYVARVGTVGMDLANELEVRDNLFNKDIAERNRLNALKADMEERGAEEVKPEEAPKAEEIVEEAAAEGEAPLKEGDVAYFEGKPVKIEEMTEDGYAIFEGEDGTPVAVEASRLTREPVVEQAPVAEEAPVAEAPAVEDVVPEAAEGQAVAEETAQEEAPLPRTKDGDIDYTTLMDQDPVRFITEMDKATKRPGSGTEFLVRAREKTEQDIAKTQKSLENETDPNKYIKNTRKLEELQAKKEAYEKALKPLEEASDMVDEIVAEQTKGEVPVEEKPAEAVEENQVENPVATPQAEEPVGPTAEEQTATQKQLQDSMDMASKIAVGKTGQIPQPEVNPIQQSMDMASKIARGKAGQVPPAPKVREQRALSSERENLVGRGIRDGVMEAFRKRAGMGAFDDARGQEVCDIYDEIEDLNKERKRLIEEQKEVDPNSNEWHEYENKLFDVRTQIERLKGEIEEIAGKDIRFFKSKKGEILGFAAGGRIYIDPNAPADTPIHEYTHLWAEMFRKVNAKEWSNIVGLMKEVGKGSWWNMVKDKYPELTNENDIAEEALAWFSGARGVQRLRAEMERIRGDKSLSSKAKMTAIRALDNLRKGIEKFWKTIAEYLGMEFTTAEEVADRVLADIAKGVNPMKVMERFKESNRQVDKAKEVLDYFNSKGFKDGQIIRSITDNGVSTYIEGSWGLHPYTKYRISDHGVGPYREQREISFNYDTRPETLYRLGAGKRARSGEAQQSKVKGPSEYDRLWDQHKDQVKGLKFSKWQSPMGLEEAMKEKPFIRNAEYLQQRTNKDGTYTYEFSEPGEQTPETRPSISFLRNMEPERGIRMQKALDRTEQAVKETGEKIEEAKEIRKAKLDAMDGKIKKVSKTLVKAAQKGYDKATVQTVTDLAKELVKEGMVDNAGRRSIKSILTVMKNVTGKENIEKDVRRLMSIVTENQIRNQQAYMAKLEKIKPVKVNSSGVKVQGRVDLFGARMMDEYKRSRGLSPEKIRQKKAALDTSDEAGKARSAGLELAEQYARLNELEEGYKAQQEEFKKTLKERWESYRKADGETKKQAFRAYKEFGESGRNSLLDTRLTISDAYGEMNRSLFRDITKGVLGAKSFKSDQLKSKDELLHGAYADNEGTSDFPLRDAKKKTAFDRDVPKFFLTPTTSFDMILRQLGRKSINGEGYMWNHFLRGAVRASGAEFDGIAAAEKEMRAKVKELTGKKNWSDLYGKKKDITVDVLFKGKAVPTTITVGNALYIYAANKMEDGRMKLRAMGIDQAAIDKMMADVPKEYKKLIDWVQEDFLPKLAKKYAPVYEKLFGASFDIVENYFPLKIAKGDRKDNIDLGNPEAFALPSTMTGALVKRTKNTSMLDIVNADAFDAVLEYVHKMEHWAAYAPLIKDLNILINDTRFKNQVMNMKTIYGSGENLWNEFVKTAEMAVGSFRPAGAKSVVDKTAVNISKGITAAKINLRVFTAIKQLLSTPAYIADANMAVLGKNMAKPGAAWNWCMENLPLFRKRWESRIAGETRLLDSEYDWGLLRNDITKGIVRFGITPNAFVDALTVSIGAKSIYETRLKRYLKDGYEKAKAEELAKEDAQILFNETQQSAEGAFLSSIQLDRTWWAASLSVFRNASMGYQRQVFDAARNLKHMGEAGYKKEFLEFETKRRIRQGVSEEDARAGAERLYKRAIRHNAVRLATFGYILPYFWYLGASLPYFLFGKDDEKKGAMEKEARWHALAGILEGLAGGNVVSDAWNILANGQKKDWQYWDLPNLPIVSDIKNLVTTFANDRVQGMNELINLVVQGGIGINPQSVTDIINATLDATDGDFSKGREALLVALKLAQVPQTRLRELYIDELGLDGEEASKLSISDIARRYAQEQVRRNAFFTGGFYSKEGRAKAENSKMRTFKMRVDERKKLHLDDARAKELGISTRNSAANMTVEQLKARAEEEAKRLQETLDKMKNK